MTDDDTSLRRHKAAATGMLVCMFILLLVGCWMSQGMAASLLKAAATAGIVGGMADWFAVTALFRHPLGIPIPHTALIPASKDRIGASLGSFLSSHVLTEEELLRLVRSIGIPGMAASILEDEGIRRSLTEMLLRQVPDLLERVSGDALADRIALSLPRIADGSAPSLLVSRLLKEMLQAGTHKPMIKMALERLRRTLQERKADIKTSIEGRVRSTSNAVVGWFAGDRMAESLMNALDAELDGQNPGSGAFMDGIDSWLREEAARFGSDPMRAYQIGNACRAALASKEARDVLDGALSSMKSMIEEDLTSDVGTTRVMLDSAFQSLAHSLREGELGQRLNSMIEEAIPAALPSMRLRLEGFVGTVVSGWDADTLVARLEAKVGPDLQFIRMNGTLVGFIVGGIIHLATMAIG